MAASASAHDRTNALTGWLDRAEVGWRLVAHRAAASAAAEAIALSRPAELVAKTVVLRAAGRLVVAVIPASERLSLPKVRALLGDVEVAVAHEDELLRSLPAYELGAMPPCGPGVPPLAVVDRRLMTYGHILCAAGDRALSLALDPEELVAATGAAVADVSAT